MVDDRRAKGDIMKRQKIVHTLVAAAFGTLAMAGAAQAITPSQSDTSAAQTTTDQDRLPASKEDSSGAQKSNGVSTDTGKSNALPPAKHAPTSVMDRATPTQKAPNEQSGRKHPPTSVMDSVTPQEKSPGTESQSGSQAPGSK
jgi:hypothetical protein